MKISQAILPVAGLGTRFLPWTKAVPKELLPIGNQPMIALLVDEAMSVGIRDICFVISKGKEAIPEYFQKNQELEKELHQRGKLHMLEELGKYDNVRFHVTYQDQMKGDGHALLQAADWVKNGTVAVLFGDDLIAGDKNGLQQLVSAAGFAKMDDGGVMLCLQEIPKELVSKYGIVDIHPDWHLGPDAAHPRLRQVTGLVEKPSPDQAPSNLGIVGKYLIPSSMFQKLHMIEEGSQGGEVRLIDALIANKDALNIYGYVFEGQRLDTGHPEGYKEAVRVLG